MVVTIGWGWGSTVIWWGRERDAVQHLIMPTTAPTAKNRLAPNVTSAEAEDPWRREDRGVLFRIGVWEGPWRGTLEQRPRGVKDVYGQRGGAHRAQHLVGLGISV